MFTKLPIHLAP